MKPKRCDQCRADMGPNAYMRRVIGLNGEVRLLCEYCALDEEQAKAEMVAKAQRRAS
jgi:hypothetical protein